MCCKGFVIIELWLTHLDNCVEFKKARKWSKPKSYTECYVYTKAAYEGKEGSFSLLLCDELHRILPIECCINASCSFLCWIHLAFFKTKISFDLFIFHHFSPSFGLYLFTFSLSLLSSFCSVSVPIPSSLSFTSLFLFSPLVLCFTLPLPSLRPLLYFLVSSTW